jgi:hypothetical protein
MAEPVYFWPKIKEQSDYNFGARRFFLPPEEKPTWTIVTNREI